MLTSCAFVSPRLHLLGRGQGWGRHADEKQQALQAQFSTSSLGASMHRYTWLLWLLREYVHLAVLTSPVLYVDWFCVESCMPSECVPRRPAARHLSWHVYLACIGGWNGSGKKVRPTLVMATTGIRSTWGRRSMCDSPRGCHVYIHVEDSTYV
jgi:hypothetical protein